MDTEEQEIVESPDEEVESVEETTPVAEETAPAVGPDEASALLKEITEDIRKADQEQYKALQRTLAKRDREIRDLREAKGTAPAPAVNLSKQLIDLMESGDFDKARALMAQQEQQQRLTQVYQAQAAIVESKKDEMRQQITDAGLDPEDERFDTVWLSVDLADAKGGDRTTLFSGAEKRLTRILSKQNPKPAEVPADDKILENKALELLKRRGLLKTSESTPSGSGASFQQIEADYAAGKVSMREYEKRREERGL